MKICFVHTQECVIKLVAKLSKVHTLSLILNRQDPRSNTIRLRNYLMRPFSRKQAQKTNKSYYNYRLSKAKMTVECAFVIVSSKLQILLEAIKIKLKMPITW